MEGPYTIYPITEEAGFTLWHLEGPTPCALNWIERETAQKHADELNAAYNAALSSLSQQGEPVAGKPLNAVASKGAQYPKFANGRTETVFAVVVDHEAGRWDQIWVLRDQALAERVANALNAPVEGQGMTDKRIDELADEEAEHDIYLISADYPDLPVRVELIRVGLKLARKHFRYLNSGGVSELVEAGEDFATLPARYAIENPLEWDAKRTRLLKLVRATVAKHLTPSKGEVDHEE